MKQSLEARGLNEQQRKVVETTEGPILVLAGAGTGKTRVVTHRVAYLLTAKKVPAKQILAVTFTNKAAGEMRQRIESLVGKKKAASLTVSTFHSLCARILRESARQAGLSRNFTIYDEKDQMGLIRTALREQRLLGKSLDPGILLSRISNAKSALISPDRFSDPARDKYAEEASQVYAAYQAMLQARSAVDFDDLIMKTIHLFQQHPQTLRGYQERFRYILVDEFQDTSAAQFLLVEQLSLLHQNLCVVGDDDQSIYSWRGAKTSNIFDFKKHFPKVKVVKLEQNYRSTQTILNAANALIQNNTQRQKKQLWTQCGEGRPIEHWVAKDEYGEAEAVALHLKSVMRQYAVPPADVAILYRSNAQSRTFEEQLRRRRIPYRLVGGQSFFDRKEVRDIVAYLRLFYNSKDEISLLRILNVPRRGIGETSVLSLIEAARAKDRPVWALLGSHGLDNILDARVAARLRSFVSLIRTYRDRFRQPGLDYTLRSLLDELDFEKELRKSSKSEKEFMRRWENVTEVMNSMAGYAAEDKRPTLGGFLERASLLTGEDLPDKKTAENAVTLMTVHAAKGLEFPLVYLVGMEEDLFPHARSLADGRESLKEERRLCYVALTRARKHLIIARAEHRRKFGKMQKRAPSRFLREIPENLIQLRRINPGKNGR